MPVFNSCCCFSLKTGCKIEGFLGIIGGSIYAILAIILFLPPEDFYKQELDFSNEEVKNLKSGAIVLLVGSLIYIISCLCLLIGAFKEKSGLVLSYLILTGIATVIDIISSIIILSQGLILEGYGLILEGYLGLLAVAINVLCWLVVYSFRQELREGEKTSGV